MESTITQIVQQHIYDHPFYNWCDPEDKDMALLVIGDGEFAAEFVDQSLQVGQMIRKSLRIYWCNSKPEIKEEYLKERPALAEFIAVDDEDAQDMYGHLFFKPTEAALDNLSENFRYIFVATEDDDYNAEIADLFKQVVSEHCLASFLKQGKIEVSFNGEADAPEYQEVVDAHTAISSYAELERMAFNTHRIWEGHGNLDYEKVKERFAQPYHYNSSVSFVLSIPYKLRSVGITGSNPQQVAAELQNVLKHAEANPNSEEARILAELAMLEHRRWVLEKVTEGAVRYTDKNGNANYFSLATSESRKKLNEDGRLIAHPCIVKCTAETPLQTGNFAEHKTWDGTVATTGLDNLDRVSIEMHRTMRAAGRQLKKNLYELDQKRDELERYAVESQMTKREFDRLNFCITNVLGDSESYAAQYETYRKSLESELYLLPEENRGKAKGVLAEISKMLFPVLEANRYRDNKEINAELIRQIPFILTNKPDVKLCMALGEASSARSNNDDYFRSVASATALYASEITYLYVYEYTTNPAVFESKCRAIRNYFDYRGKKCAIRFRVFFRKDEKKVDAYTAICDSLAKLQKDGIIQDYAMQTYDSVDTLPEEMLAAVSDLPIDYYDGTNPMSRSSLLNSKVVRAFSEKYPYFEFDSYSRQFCNLVNCEYLQYMQVTSFIQVEDMFALLNAKDKEFNYMDFADVYKELWEIYCGDAIGERDFYQCTAAWTKIADIVKTGGAENMDIDTRYDIKDDTDMSRVVRKMLEAMRDKGFITSWEIYCPEGTAPGNRKITFKVLNQKVKWICAKAGDLLESYVYFEAVRTGWFDDVQGAFKFKWECDDVVNELDCILTKGFRSVLVECKSTKEVKESFYLTLDSLADHFGIGYKKVLIVLSDMANGPYSNYVLRGQMMDVITISTKEELKNIGKILKYIMEQ